MNNRSNDITISNSNNVKKTKILETISMEIRAIKKYQCVN
jgi:hypothetical protein